MLLLAYRSNTLSFICPYHGMVLEVMHEQMLFCPVDVGLSPVG